MSSGSRGIRNHNPGNIEFHPRNRWRGQLGLEEGLARPRFVRFDTAENGIRALARLLLNYRSKRGMPGVGASGIDTVRETISRWAPADENDTEAYINAVARSVGVLPNDVIDIPVTRQDAAIFHIQRACQAALSVARHLIWRERLGIAQSNAHVFDLLGGAGWCELELLDSVKGVVELSDTAVRKPRVLQISMLISAITHEAGKLQAFACAVLRRERSG